jgi:hypothetical protein
MMYNDERNDKEALKLQLRPPGSVSAYTATTRMYIVGITVNTVEVEKIMVVAEGVIVVGTRTGENVEMETGSVGEPAGLDVSALKMVILRVA